MSYKEKLEKAIAAMKESIDCCASDAKEDVLIEVLEEIGVELDFSTPTPKTPYGG